MKLSDTQLVNEHISKLDSEMAPIVQTIRQLILTTDTAIGERIKWNNPSFYYTGEMEQCFRRLVLSNCQKRFESWRKIQLYHGVKRWCREF